MTRCKDNCRPVHEGDPDCTNCKYCGEPLTVTTKMTNEQLVKALAKAILPIVESQYGGNAWDVSCTLAEQMANTLEEDNAIDSGTDKGSEQDLPVDGGGR